MKAKTRMAKALLDRTVVPIARYIAQQIGPKPETPIEMVYRRAKLSSAEYIEQFGSSALLFSGREKLWMHALLDREGVPTS